MVTSPKIVMSNKIASNVANGKPMSGAQFSMFHSLNYILNS